jgi:chitin disaccharide deacetylase
MNGHRFERASSAPSVWASNLLGFPTDARVLIINADDFGMYHAVNIAVVRSIEEGVASSCSLMVPCPWALHAMQLLRDRREIPFGIHLTLVIDVPHYRWGPLTAKERVPSLLDETGEMFGDDGIPELLARARLDEVELEFRAQIDAVVDAGLTPTHLDFHSIADGGREDILDLTVALAEEYGLAVRVWLGPGRRKLRARGLPVVDHPFLDSTRLALDGKRVRFANLLRNLPAGLSEWAVHPSLGNEESQAIGSMWRERQTDYEFLMSPEAHDLIRQEGIAVIDYRTIQHAWRQKTAHQADTSTSQYH